MSEFYKRFLKLCAERNEKPTAVLKTLDMSSSHTTKWNNGAEPRPFTLIRLADYFGVSPEWLAGKTEDRDVKETEEMELMDGRERPEMKVLFDLLQDTSRQEVNALIEMVKTFKQGSGRD